MQLPESYWTDINRYTDEIFTGVVPEVQTLPFSRKVRMSYTWDAAEPDIEAILVNNDYRMFGIHKSDHSLNMVGLVSYGIVPVHHIEFNPVKQVINRVHDDAQPLDGQTTIREDANAIWQRHKMAKIVGILLPTEVDYELLHSELRRGADYRRAEMDN